MTSLSMAPPAQGQDTTDSTPAYGPTLGIFPRTPLGRLFFLWGVLNLVLGLLPVYGILGNSAEIGALGMPVTVLYCYAMFSLNCFLGVAYYLTRGKDCVEMTKSFVEEGADT
ncbi:hypothetical protein GFB49_19025 [Epibacterium sp. SM1979]|uniref:Uncharacterized protein n=1 Tax=Tritonibacter litoralis TaxID=2662264 RepID=A0A843YPN5_9RHOB|nr:hypothetical protein [Tritonibacter litoralis]MQQ10557.1 hypothetical protein [Tritonibacter litoralis]